ncbi:MAG: glycosyltransferase family 39 protein [Planctomycetes bacterium]|nr:glycosyltransferase family 39 protein [Planctomycetota bacterium]
MVSSAASGPSRSRVPFASVGAAAVVAIVLAVLLHHHARGRLPLALQHVPIAAADVREDSGRGFVVALGTDWLSSHARPSPARLLEDGRELGPANALHDAIRQQGGGRFSLWHGNLYFSSSDGSDPRQNGRRYEIVWPTPVAAGWRHGSTALAVLLALLAAWLGRRAVAAAAAACDRVAGPCAAALRRLGGADEPRRAWWLAAGIGLLAVAVRAVDHLLLQADLAGHISGALVMGVPFSDAQGWDNQGASIMAGHGLVGMWSARRPFYAFVLGALYTWTGPSVLAVVVLHALVGGLTSALVCRIGQRAVHPAIGLVAGVAFAFDPVSLEYSNYVLTETVGTFLFVLSLHQLIVAVQERRNAAAWWGGVAFVLSNLTRTLTLPAMPLLALLLWWRGAANGRGWRRGAWLAASFTAGFVLPLGAWIVRQHAVHDLTTISDNTASGLYAAASPTHGTWSSMVDREADLAGVPNEIKPRYDWFMARFRAELAADPTVYARNVAASAWVALGGLGQTPLPVRWLLAALVAYLWFSRLPACGGHALRRVAWTAASAALLAVVVLVEGPFAAGAGLLGLLLATVWRPDRAMSLALAGHVGTIAAVALFALGSDHRLLLMTSWLQPIGLGAFVYVVGTACLRRLAGAAAPAVPVPAAPVAAWAPRVQRFAIVAVLVFAVANLLWLAWRNYAQPEPLRPPLPRPVAASAQALVARVAELRPDWIRADERQPEGWYRHSPNLHEQIERHGGLVVAFARLARHRYPVAAETRVTHWSRMFDPRPYDRLFTYAETSLPDGVRGPACTVLVEPLPPAELTQVALVGRADVDADWIIEECCLEVLAWVPVADDGTFDPQAVQLAGVPEHVRRVDALRRAP